MSTNEGNALERNPLEKSSLEQSSLEHKNYLKKLQRDRLSTNLWRIGLLIGLLVVWEAAAQLGWIDPFITSSPSRVVNTILSLHQTGQLWVHIGVTVLETVGGFLLGTVLGIIIAVALWWSPKVCRIADPYLVVLNSLPKVALGPIIIVWIGAGVGAILTMALLISVVVTIMNMLAGFLAVSEMKMLLMRSFGASRLQILQKVVLPQSIPTIISTLKINVGMSWVGVITGEFLVAQKGIGYLIVYGGQVFKLDLVMAGVVVLAIAAALMYIAVSKLEAFYLRTRP
ncbi:MAG: ABC transporter permease [Christensenellales bacterium]|jgi:NitT/TauT family transport system permease protein